ncbi:MAG: hypothetical protein WBR35_07430, partial [Anaerolineae bacterium]
GQPTACIGVENHLDLIHRSSFSLLASHFLLLASSQSLLILPASPNRMAAQRMKPVVGTKATFDKSAITGVQ